MPTAYQSHTTPNEPIDIRPQMAGMPVHARKSLATLVASFDPQTGGTWQRCEPSATSDLTYSTTCTHSIEDYTLHINTSDEG